MIITFQIVIPAEKKVENEPDRPNSLQIQISKLTASNTHVEEKFFMADLKTLLEQYSDCDMFATKEFPNDTQRLAAIPKIFHDFANARVNPYLCSYALDLVKGRMPDSLNESNLGTDALQVLLRTNTLKRDMRCDMWGLCLDQVWLEFLGVPTSRTRPVPFVESFPLTLWLCQSNVIPDGVVLPSNSSSSISSGDNENTSEVERENRKNRKLLKHYYSDDSNKGSSPTDSSGEGRTASSSLSSNSCDIQRNNVQYTSLKVADFDIVAQIGGKIRAQLSHPQYLFLMRLLESVTNLQTQVNADIEDFFTGDKSPAKSFSLPLVIPEIEFAMVCPYIAELLPLSTPADLLRSPTPEVSDGKDAYAESIDNGVPGINITNNSNTQDGYTENTYPPVEPYTGKLKPA